MSERIRLILSSASDDNARAYDSLSRLPDVNIVSVHGGAGLEKYIPMPFIEDQKGYRHFGLSGIDQFVSRASNGSQKLD